MKRISKEGLRKSLRAKRAALSSKYQAEQAMCFAQRFSTIASVLQGKRIAAYCAHAGELDVLRAIFTITSEVCLPVVVGSDIRFYSYKKGERLIPGPYGILQPTFTTEQNRVSIGRIDVLLTPLVACDLDGGRIGNGFGYYDRALNEINESSDDRPCTIGCCYDWQIQNSLKAIKDPHDFPLDIIATPSKISSGHKK